MEAIPADRTLSDMLETGEIDALYTAEAPTCFDRRSPAVRRLFEDYATVEREFFAQTGLFPIMHTVVIKRELYEAAPWIAQSLTKAFTDAQRIAYAELAEMTALKIMLPWLPANLASSVDAMGEDFWPYGLDRNASTLNAFLRYAYEQGLIPEPVEPATLFAKETLETSRT